MKVKVQLSHLDNDSCSVSFREQSLELRFRTRCAHCAWLCVHVQTLLCQLCLMFDRDQKFLRMYEGSSSSTTFVWNIRLL